MTTAERTAEQLYFIASYLHWNGENRDQLSAAEAWEVFCQGDGYGEGLSSEQLKQINSGFDWSHVRDSSERGMEMMLSTLKSILFVKELRQRREQAAQFKAAVQYHIDLFFTNPSDSNYAAIEREMLAYQKKIKG